uniref:solute carrier family 22 member 5-like isoform X2 n=1 Tax=Scatophagus argus TaxID=75038 RepID=UPI001ED830C3|nr:solute carrier family 22 member 5-like isoform X2 [Scatophagus argus]
MKNFDDSTAFLGLWGRFQQIIFFLLCGSIIPNGLTVFSVVFLADAPSHHCLIPEVNLTQDWRNATIPIQMVNGKQELSRCSRYRLDVVRNLSAQGLIPGIDVNLTGLEQEGCMDGWSYSKDIYESTIVSEFDLVCSEQWKQPFTTTVLFLGILLGSSISGQLSDRFGRKPLLFATIAVQTIFSFAQIFSPSWTVFAVFLFITGLGQFSNFVSAFVLGVEILPGNVRVMFSSMGVCLSFAFGYMVLPLFAYFLRDWKSLLLGISLPGLVFLPCWWLIPESPRWLISQGRVEEAEAVIRKAAKINKIEAPQVIFEDYSAHAKETKTRSKKHNSVLQLLSTRNVRKTTAILCLLWFSHSVGYFALSLNTSQLYADPYLSCFISAVVEIPAYIFIWLILLYFPRRLSVISIFLLGAMSLYFIPLVPQSLSYLSVALEMLGKFAVTSCSALMYTYTAELYPTVLRNTATGACSTVSRVGSCITPFLLELKFYFKHLPYIIMGTLAVASAFAAFFLPETFRRPLPQTIQQMHKAERTRPDMPD